MRHIIAFSQKQQENKFVCSSVSGLITDALKPNEAWDSG